MKIRCITNNRLIRLEKVGIGEFGDSSSDIILDKTILKRGHLPLVDFLSNPKTAQLSLLALESELFNVSEAACFFDIA